MQVTFRKATETDIPAIAAIYDEIHTEEEAGRAEIGWDRKVYPTERTAQEAVAAGEMYVAEIAEDDGTRIVGSARINKAQVDVYAQGNWAYDAADDEVLVMHTLTISPSAGVRGLGTRFVAFYEQLAVEAGIHELRIDTNERNTRARSLYAKLGYTEIGMVPTVFNGIPGVHLVLIEKHQ